MLDQDGFILAKKDRAARQLKRIDRPMKPIAFLTDVELACIPTGSVFVYDIETYPNFFYVAFKHLASGKYVQFERSPGTDFSAEKLRWMLWRYCFVGFNSRNFDMPVMQYAMQGHSCEQIYSLVEFIVSDRYDATGRKQKATNFVIEKNFGFRISEYNHIDLIEVAPLQGSLKLYTGRVHCKRMQDLPIPVGTVLTAEDAAIVRPYCCNDLDNTELLYNVLLPQIELREQLGKEYGIDLRSKSDAQLAEAVINKELQKLTGEWPRKLESHEIPDFVTYEPPSWVQFQTKPLQDALDAIRQANFMLDGLGKPKWPIGLGEKDEDSSSETWQLIVKINGVPYKLGMGGIHSQEATVTHVAGPDEIIADNDVESFYPRTIINERLFPPHLGPAFLQVYETIVNRRLDAKAAGNKIVSDSLKITINGSFGKLGNRFSTLFAPKLLLQVTITGQLALLMLIEALALAGINVISANTDGFVSRYNKADHAKVRAIIESWEKWTNYKTEETRYAWMASRDVNNYLAAKLKQDKQTKQWTNEIEECKVKGIYSERGSALNSPLSKNPETLICSDAVQAFLTKRTPLIKTIHECKDFRRFVAVKNVKDGGEKNGYYLGKVVRWYYAKNEAGYIGYSKTGNKVPKTDGAKPCMDLPDEFPEDINYEWYIREATRMLYDVGYFKRPETLPLF